MKKSDSNKVLSHIDEAKNWLDEAKEEYTQSNRVRGELNLNLAQAEVKYAWELSRQQNVTQIEAVSARRAIKYFPAAAAVLFVVLGLTGGLFWVKQNAKTETPALTAKNKNILIEDARHIQTVNPKTPVAEAAAGLTAEKSGRTLTANHSNQKQLAPIGAPEVVRVKSTPKIVKTDGAKDAKNRVTTDENKPSVGSAPTDKMEKSQVVDNTAKTGLSEKNQTSVNVAQTEQDLAPNAVKLSVVSLVIDEEALAKEASYSLRNGK